MGSIPLLTQTSVQYTAPAERVPEVPNGTILTYQGRWPISFFTSKVETLAKVKSVLAAKAIDVRDYRQLDATLFGTITMELTLKVQNNVGFAKVDDVRSIVANGVYQAVGQLPTSESMPFVQRPGEAKASTGQPNANPQQNKSGDNRSWWEQLTGWFDTLKTGTLLGGLGVLLLLGFAFLFIGRPRD